LGKTPSGEYTKWQIMDKQKNQKQQEIQPIDKKMQSHLRPVFYIISHTAYATIWLQ
jgi:hypothetical protein